jgi:hypothetical protein
MKYAIKMVPDDMTYTPSFMKIGSAIQKLTVGIRNHCHELLGN